MAEQLVKKVEKSTVGKRIAILAKPATMMAVSAETVTSSHVSGAHASHTLKLARTSFASKAYLSCARAGVEEAFQR